MEINVLIEEGLEVDLETEWLQSILEKPLLAENLPSNTEISLVLTSQERIHELNRDYRGKDKPTDVLSFSMTEQKNEEEPTDFIAPPDGLLHLGEVIISYPQAVIQAGEHGHPFKNEIATLIVHGVLHILGYDHENSEMEPAMRAKEKELLDQIFEELL
jgi:probable rRNA maturation factor